MPVLASPLVLAALLAVAPAAPEAASVRLPAPGVRQGLITTRYAINLPSSGASELGVAYLLPASVEAVSWERRGLWSVSRRSHRPPSRAGAEDGPRRAGALPQRARMGVGLRLVGGAHGLEP